MRDTMTFREALTFNEMNTFQKVDHLSEMLGEACFMVDSCIYQDMTDDQKTQVKEKFFDYLKSEKITITGTIMNKSTRLYEGSPLSKMLQEYKEINVNTKSYVEGISGMTLEKAYEEAAQTIQEGEKYTLLGHNDFGFPVTMHTRIHRAYMGSWAQYDNVLIIEHQPKRKRKIYRQYIKPYETFILWEGWIDTNSEDFWETEQKDGYTITTSKHTSFDKHYLKETMQNVKIKPIAILDRDYYTNADELEFIYKVVVENGVETYTLPQLGIRYNITGENHSRSGRIELQGQPTISSLLGPMWDGYENGKAVIRYETQEMYNLLSN